MVSDEERAFDTEIDPKAKSVSEVFVPVPRKHKTRELNPRERKKILSGAAGIFRLGVL
jgi:hypothetical protein